MNTLFGKHPGARANHAKGVVAEGSFTPSAEAAKISKASLFKGPAVPVTIRFSDATGVPTIPDGAANANPHGMALKFKLSDGSEMDVVTNALKYFPVATGEEFRDLLRAVADSGPNAATRPHWSASQPPTRPPPGRAGPPSPRRASPGRPITASTPSSSSTRPASASRSGSASSRCRARRSCPPWRRPSAARTT